jgi:4'-phosphopantetheinyl transferase
LRSSDFRIDPGQVHVWVVPLDDPDKKRRRQLAHVAERQILGEYLGVAPDALEFDREPGGKPVLRGAELQFNLSHSGERALLAISGGLPVGVDIQAPHPTTAKPWFARRICTEREYEHVMPDADPGELLRLWTRKEAVIKARGEGSYVSVDEIDVLDRRVAGGWVCVDIWPQTPQEWGYHAAVATRAQPGVSVMSRGPLPGL